MSRPKKQPKNGSQPSSSDKDKSLKVDVEKLVSSEAVRPTQSSTQSNTPTTADRTQNPAFSSDERVLPPHRSNYKLENVCGDNLAMESENQSFALTGLHSNNSNIPIDLKLTIDINPQKLLEQAIVFSDDFLSEGSVRYNYILGNRPDKWKKILQEVYIYSYFKSFVIGFQSNNSIERYIGANKVFIGHAILFEILKKRRFSHEYSVGLVVNYSIEMDEQRYNQIQSELITQFPFLKRTLFDEVGIGTNVFDPEYDRVLDYMTDAFYVPHNLFIVELKDQNYLDYLSGVTLPLGNSFYGEDHEGFYYSFSAPYNIISDSYSWGRACFISCQSSTIRAKYKYIKFNNPRLFAKFDARSIVGKDIQANPRLGDPDNLSLRIPPLQVDPSQNGDGNPGSDDDRNKVLVMIGDQLKEVSTEKNIDISSDLELATRFQANFQKDGQNNVLTKDGSSELAINVESNIKLLEVLGERAFLDLRKYLLRGEISLPLDNFELTKNGFRTKDNQITINVSNDLRDFNVYDFIKICSTAWFAKKQGMLSLAEFEAYISTYSYRIQVTKNYHITVMPGGSISINPQTKLPFLGTDRTSGK